MLVKIEVHMRLGERGTLAAILHEYPKIAARVDHKIWHVRPHEIDVVMSVISRHTVPKGFIGYLTYVLFSSYAIPRVVIGSDRVFLTKLYNALKEVKNATI